MCGKTDVLLQSKAVQAGCEVFGENIIGIVHMNVTIPQKYYVWWECGKVHQKACKVGNKILVRLRGVIQGGNNSGNRSRELTYSGLKWVTGRILHRRYPRLLAVEYRESSPSTGSWLWCSCWLSKGNRINCCMKCGLESVVMVWFMARLTDGCIIPKL